MAPPTQVQLSVQPAEIQVLPACRSHKKWKEVKSEGGFLFIYVCVCVCTCEYMSMMAHGGQKTHQSLEAFVIGSIGICE